MKFDLYSYTNKGGRDYNEDFCGNWQESSQGVFVIADGLGGHGHGEVASELAVKHVIGVTKKEFKLGDDDLIELIDGTNDALMNYQDANPAYKNIRTTIAAAFYSQDVFKYINVGDSRLYFFKNGCLYAQSKDHSVPQMAVELGEIRAEDIRKHEDRSKLLKVLGDVRNLNIKKAEPGIKLNTGDAFLICTDGFWEYVLETEMEIDLVKSSSAEEWCEFMCKRLLRRVTGDNDNFTVMCGIMSEPVIATSWIPPPQPVPVIPIAPVTPNSSQAVHYSANANSRAAYPSGRNRRGILILIAVAAVLLAGALILFFNLPDGDEIYIPAETGVEDEGVFTPHRPPPSTTLPTPTPTPTHPPEVETEPETEATPASL
jgi:serine/threonine protein phosphatase PrpC